MMVLQLQHSCLYMLIVVIFSCNYVVLVKGAGVEECVSFNCGNINNIHYPFWPSLNATSKYQRYCGYPSFGINCTKGKAAIAFSKQLFFVKHIDYLHKTLTVVDADFLGNSCPRPRHNYTFWETVVEDDFQGSDLSYSMGVKFLTFFSNCKSYPSWAVPYVSCLGSNATNRSYIFEHDAIPMFNWYGSCEETFFIPVLHNNNSNNVSMDYGSTLQLGFEMKWHQHLGCEDCEMSGGSCGYDRAINALLCFCKGWYYSVHGNATSSCDPGADASGNDSNNADGRDPRTNKTDSPANTGGNRTSSTNNGNDNNTGTTNTTHGDTNNGRINVSIGALIGVVAGAGALVIIILFVYRRNLLLQCRTIYKWSNKAGDSANVDRFLENYGPLALHRYTYSDLKRFTNSFKDKLGQGGYGSVFKGKLNDGDLVAVKVLTESKGNGEEFINEVSTIGRTNHVNVVSLIGFCYEGPKRALVYEFMPNGSLEKFIYNKKGASSTHPLGWENLYQIALGIANGLEYLHRGCNTRILHFDIKPHNILLDEDFIPKISDFGLAKLCPTKDQSIVSMSNARGTVGYIAPEICCRNFGGVSSKSDVYSYGMMVLEMVGGRKNIDATVENISEIYFPQWIYNHLEQHGSMGSGVFKEMFEEESVRKMIIVGLWCIQTHSANRPSMSMVVEMLQKSVGDLQMPPNPFRDHSTFSTSSQSTS